MKSPITGKQMSPEVRKEKLTYKGEVYEIWYNYYLDMDNGETFTDDILDDANLAQVYQQYEQRIGKMSEESVDAIKNKVKHEHFVDDFLIKSEFRKEEIDELADGEMVEHTIVRKFLDNGGIYKYYTSVKKDIINGINFFSYHSGYIGGSGTTSRLFVGDYDNLYEHDDYMLGTDTLDIIKKDTEPIIEEYDDRIVYLNDWKSLKTGESVCQSMEKEILKNK